MDEIVPADVLARVIAAYEGRDADLTRALFRELETCEMPGQIAINLYRAHKNSARAKVYRRRSSAAAAYDTKQWAMENLARILGEHAEACGLTWGWGVDPDQPFHNVVLYVDTPRGQLSFHTDARLAGPDYPGKWDGEVGAGPGRLCRWIADILESRQ